MIFKKSMHNNPGLRWELSLEAGGKQTGEDRDWLESRNEEETTEIVELAQAWKSNKQ